MTCGQEAAYYVVCLLTYSYNLLLKEEVIVKMVEVCRTIVNLMNIIISGVTTTM